MSDELRVTFPKEAREKAKEEGKTLLAICIHNKYNPNGKASVKMHLHCDVEDADKAFLEVCKVFNVFKGKDINKKSEEASKNADN